MHVIIAEFSFLSVYSLQYLHKFASLASSWVFVCRMEGYGGRVQKAGETF